jgi:hypothetical protein
MTGLAKYNIGTAVYCHMTEVVIVHRYLHLLQARQRSSLCPRPKPGYLIVLALGGTVPASDLAQQAAATTKDAAEQQAQDQAQQAVEKRMCALLDVFQPLMVVFGLGVSALAVYNILMVKARESYSGGDVPVQLKLSSYSVVLRWH